MIKLQKKSSYPLPPELNSIERLLRARSGKISVWSAQWRQDLLRTILSDGQTYVIKKFTGNEKVKRKTVEEILKNGADALSKHESHFGLLDSGGEITHGTYID